MSYTQSDQAIARSAEDRRSQRVTLVEAYLSRARHTQGALLTMGDYYGSLAATRCLGEAEVPIFFAEHRRYAPARWSRFVKTRPVCPDPQNIEAFGDWLEAFGQQHPGLFLYPTSDDIAYIIALRRDKLERSFILYQPSESTIMGLLDKRQLSQAAAAVGLNTPETLFFSNERELQAAIKFLGDGVLVKPRSQVGLRTKGKGYFCRGSPEIAQAVARFRSVEIYDMSVLRNYPSLEWPMLQRYYPSAVKGMLSVSGFVAEDGSSCMMAAEKVFQRPRRLGVGVAFEARAVPEELADKLLKLCRATGYYGIFEAEFINEPQTNRHLLVDFNPRYYGQMGFEIARGMRLPLMAYYAATGQTQALNDELTLARTAMAHTTAISSTFALGWALKMLVRTQTLGGQMTREEAERWRAWALDNQRPHFDALSSEVDKLPALFETCNQWLGRLRHPRDFYRKFFLDT